MRNDDTRTDRTRTALLLAAGSGCRLRPLTYDQPKCLTEIGGIPILERLVDRLCQHGFRRLVVVVGHLEHKIREFLGDRKGSLSIEYVVNPQYRTTNNILSLWLARNVIQEPFLLVESDLIFESELLYGMLQPDTMAVSPLQPWMDGSTVTVDRLQRVRAFQLGNVKTTDGVRYKTVNIYNLSLQSWRQILQGLEQHLAENRVNEYYESVFSELVADGILSLEAVSFDPRSWCEIDTVQDLRKAEVRFAATGREQRFEA